MTRDSIMEKVWGTDYEGETRTVDMHIKTLRQKLGSAGDYIKTDVYQISANIDGKYEGHILISDVIKPTAKQAITSLNMGDGTPVTLTYLNGQRIEQCPYEDKRKVFDNELSTSMQKLAKDFKEIEKDAVDILENKRTLSKSDREIILKAFSKVYRKLTDEMPFIYSQFNEQMDKTVTEAKAEIECHIQARKDDLAALAMKNIAVGIEPTDELPESEEAEDNNLYEEYENEDGEIERFLLVDHSDLDNMDQTICVPFIGTKFTTIDGGQTFTPEEGRRIIKNLKEYCSLDAYGLFLVYRWILELLEKQ